MSCDLTCVLDSQAVIRVWLCFRSLHKHVIQRFKIYSALAPPKTPFPTTFHHSKALTVPLRTSTMVVISSQGLPYRSTYDEYWKIANWTDKWTLKRKLTHELQRHKYKVPSSTNMEKLAEANARCQRGFLSYNGCQPRELVAFCAQRHIQIPGGPKAKKAQLMQCLHEADEQLSFPRFMEMPPEVRILVYVAYYSSLGRIFHPTQPPLSEVSRLIRQESLPLFYTTSKFLLHGVNIFGDPYYGRKKGKFFHEIGIANLGLIRNLAINYFAHCQCSYEMVEWTEGQIQYFRSGKYPDVEYHAVNDPSDVARRVSNYIQNVEGKPGGRRLRTEDIEEVERQIRKHSDPCSRCGR